MKRKNLKKDNFQKGRFEKGKFWERTVPESKNKKKNGSGQGNLKKDNSA